METNLTLQEIKLLSRNQFIRLLKSEGFKVKVVENDDNYLSVSYISKKEMYQLCKVYGMTGWYDVQSKTAIIGMWGNAGSQEAIVKSCGITTLKHNLRKLYDVEQKISKMIGITLIIKDITEKRFRRYLVEYDIKNFMYNYADKIGYIMIRLNN
ncbi:hypothetical protein M2451_003797 [Dysgonomonas sp. PFB1-18]|uniref:hypothetical protein n=1 Tax=unclassified Dysgonomonas TaxID=2630389 RepID=UPI00247651F1|nr:MULTISPECIES: hypothetical protein [unclassified Dysgonomonas]MDH6310933.1 hypothetical protein [Dysgonomonas sp. PF1-14]MDH6340852.1 hypothetical protein [Dysgonomonas sp. PF1-16]MDH6382456.1 hypothetical protein [Dysgonomonas sp. PFB1-18]MDH6399805.1 hypothetical protein [Dysgonomonas sp. PF1-23]